MKFGIIGKGMVLLALSAVVFAAGAACFWQEDEPERETVSIELDWFPNTNHVGIYVAESKGYFDEENLDVEINIPADPAAVAQLVGAGRRDFGIFYQTDTLLARNEGVPVVAVRAIVQRPLNCVMTLSASGITRPSDLRGKKIGYPGIDWNVKMLETMLASDGLTMADVDLQDVGWSLWETLAAGTVDALIGAYWSHEKIVLENNGYPTTIVFADDHGVPAYYEMMLITSETMLEEKPDVVERFARAFTKGFQYAHDNQIEAIDILAEMNPDQAEIETIERAAIPDLAIAWEDESGGVGRMTEDRWNSVAAFMKEKGMIDADLNVDEAWVPEYATKDWN